MKRLSISIVLLGTWIAVSAQNSYDKVLAHIEQNNTTLAALREQMKAQRIENRTGLTPDNPEVEFNYLWGNPSSMGNRTDVKVTQSFDFPSVYVYRNRIANKENANAELAYKDERIGILLQAKQALIDLTYYNALAAEYAVRLGNAERIARTYAAKLASGETNAIENNKAQLNLQSVQSEVSRIDIERETLLAELRRMNGGQEIVFGQVVYPDSPLPGNFGEWYTEAEAKSPALQYLRGQVEVSQHRVKLNRAMSLPKFSAGYMSEKIVGEHFQGVTVGISVPLWQNKNRVKQAKAQVRAAETVVEDTKLQFYNRLRNLYARASRLQRNAEASRASLVTYDNAGLLQKALDAGELSLLEYLLETEYYYATLDKIMQAERDRETAVAELSAVEL